MDQNMINRKANSALERLTALEKVVEELSKRIDQNIQALQSGVSSIVSGADQAFSQMGQKLDALDIQVNAAAEMLGWDAFLAKAVSIGQERMKANISAQVNDLQNKILEGRFVAAEAVSETSEVIGVEVADGKEFDFKGRVSVALQTSLKELFLGKRVGDEIDLSNGHKFKVLEVYVPAPVPAPVTSEKQLPQDPTSQN